MSEDVGSNGVKKENIYRDKEEELVLVLLSESYSKLDAISVGTSGHSSCPILYHLLTI